MNILAFDNLWAGTDIARDLAVFSPELVLVGTLLAIVAAPIVLGRGPRAIAGITAVGIIAALIMVIRVGFHVAAHGPVSGLSPSPASGMLIADNLAVFFKFALLIFLLGVFVLWWIGSAEEERDAPEFFILLIGSALGMALMVSTTNLLMMVVAVETASLPSYAIVAFNKRDAKAAEASLKYMVFGAISAAIMIYGVSLAYGLTGSLDLSTAARGTLDAWAFENRPAMALALICIMAGVAFKISAVPFHFWCPDAFEGAKVEVTTWLSVASKAAGVILALRLVQALCGALDTEQSLRYVAPLAWGVGLMAMVTCTWANFAAYHQSSVKRLLAYSSIAHAGYMLMAVAVVIHPETLRVRDEFHSVVGVLPHPGTSALLAYLFIYLFMNLGAFAVVALVNWQTGTDHISAFTGLIRRAPWLAVSLAICLFSLIGMPPLAGFIGKWWVLVALGQQGTGLGWLLVVVMVLNTLFSLWYYMRLVIQMCLMDDEQAALRPSPTGLVLANGCALALILLFVLVGPLKRVCDRFTFKVFDPNAVAAMVDGMRATATVEAAGATAGENVATSGSR